VPSTLSLPISVPVSRLSVSIAVLLFGQDRYETTERGPHSFLTGLHSQEGEERAVAATIDLEANKFGEPS